MFAQRYGGLRGLRDLDYLLMAQGLGRSTRARGELLCFCSSINREALRETEAIEEFRAAGRPR